MSETKHTLTNLDKLQAERFWTHVDRGANCWRWKGSRIVGKYPYGRFNANGRGYFAHRVAYQLVKGRIPKKHHVHHKCGNAICVNPAHLQALTVAEHTLLGQSPPALNARKKTCIRGHKFTLQRRDGARDCPQCRKIQIEKDKLRLRKITVLRRNARELAEAVIRTVPGSYKKGDPVPMLVKLARKVEAALGGKAE